MNPLGIFRRKNKNPAPERVQAVADLWDAKISDDGRMICSPCGCADISLSVDIIAGYMERAKVPLLTVWRGIEVRTDVGDSRRDIERKFRSGNPSNKCDTCGRSLAGGSCEHYSPDTAPCMIAARADYERREREYQERFNQGIPRRT